MEQQREVYNPIMIFILTIVSIHIASSSSQNLHIVTTTIDIGSTDGDKITDHAWLYPLNTTTSSTYQDFTTYLPTSTNAEAEEILDSSETNVLNRYARPFQHNGHARQDLDNPDEPPDHVIPYSEHEEARDVPTQPKYVGPGIWAKPPPDKDIPLDFVPTKMHAQVRGKHTVKRLPQREAIESAETDEEKRNAARLREIVTNSKVNTVYTEEGYEDSAYDHAGHIRDANFHEGFARKLHDRKKNGENWSSDKKKDLEPDELKDYEEDYQDHLQENRKFETDGEDNLIGYGRNSWEESETDPKLVAENNIQKLEEDIEKDAEEAERSSKTYENAQESKLRNDIKTDSSKLEESHVNDNLKHKNKSIKTKKKKSKLQNEKDDNVTKKSKQSRKLKQKKKLHPENYRTTVLSFKEADLSDVEKPARPHGFVTSFPKSQIYSMDSRSMDQTTPHYVSPFDTTASFLQVEDEPTTIDYRQLFWDYFKARQGPSTTESTFVLNSTTMNPQQEARTPIAVATIDGHGPYLLVTKEESITSPPSTFLDLSSFRPRNLFSDHVEFGPTSAQTHSRHLLGQSGDVNYAHNGITTSTIASAFTSVQPLPLLSPEDIAYSSSTTLLDTTVSSSTPTVMTVNFTQEAYAQIADFHENPFLGPVLDNSNIVVAKNKLKYKVLARAKPSSREKKPVKSVAHQSFRQQAPLPPSKEENEYKNIRDKLNAKYNKMLSYIKNKQDTMSFPREKKIVFPEDFTLRRPPIQQAAYSIFLTDHPSPTNRSSVSAESESSRETNWRSLLQNQHRSEPVKLPFRFDAVSHVQPVHPVYHKNSLPTTKLSPPPPLPLASTYANYRSNKQNDNRHSHVSGKSQKKRDNAFKHLSLNPEANWRTRSRRKRSGVSEFRDGSSNGADINVKAATNNSVTNDNKSEQQNKSSFDRVIDRSEGKSSSPRVIDAPIDVPNAMKLAFPARSREDESGTSRNKNSSIGERKNIEDTRETIGIPEIIEKGQIVIIQSAKQDVRISDTEIAELAKKKRDIGSETSTRNWRNEVNEKGHEELLNESPKISGDVIDEEIAVRFNEKDDETSPKKNGKIEIEVPSFDYVEELVEDEFIKPSTTTEAAIDLKKYPFYNHDDVPSASALKYVVDPETIPRKTSRGMEFYDSRNAYKQCDEVEPNLDKVLPEKEEPDPERGPQENLPRLRGLGDKLDCFKAKYFDENPLDNPLFGEKLVEEPTLPTELNPTKFASKIMVLPEENDDYVVPQVSKKPERSSRQWRNRIRPYETLESIRVNYKHDPQTGRGRNAYFHSMRGTRLTNMMRRVKNRKHRPKISTTTSLPKFQTSSYQNLVYEDVMGNIRNMKNTYQVYEMTTLPPSPILITAGSENMLKVVDVASNSSNEKSTSKPDVIDITDVTNNTKSSEIKGLLPPPKYLIQRQSYRKPRPPAKSRGSLLRSTTLPRIIAHHHTIKLNKRSITDDAEKNSSESTINENKKTTINGESVKVDIGNDTFVEAIEKAMNKTNATTELLDLEIEESRPISTLDRNLFTTLKMDDKKKRRNSTSSGLRSEPQKTVYTIRDRIRYSKPKWDTRGFGKFTTSSTTDEDSRRKEPRYNRIERKKKLVDDRQNNSTIMNSTESTSGIESAKSLIGDRESSTTEVYHAEESAVQQMIYHKMDEYSEPENAKNIDAESEESFFKEDTEESTTNTYQVSEEVDENVATTTATANSPSTKEVLDLREYLKSDPPGYAEAFSEDATTPLNKHHANINHESDDSEEKQEEETDFRKVANSRDNDSSEKIEEQVETPTEANLFSQDDDSEDLSKEEEDSNKDKTFFTYPKRPSLTEGDDNEEKTAFYKPFPFSRYKSTIKKESEENNEEENDEESEEKSKTYVFPWHFDKEHPEDKRQWLYDVSRYEYPWERRDRLARERRKRRQDRARFFDDEDEEESRRYGRPIYSWEKYNVPSKRANVRHDISRRYIDKSDEDSSTEQVPLTKFSSRYSSSDIKPQFSGAHEISRSIKKFLEEDDEPEGKTSKEIESRSPSYARKSLSSSDRGISRGTLVPEDITQPPGRKNARRKVSRVDKNVSNNSRFDSKKLRSEDVDEEKEEEAAEYLKLNRGSLDEPIEVTSSQPSQLSNGTKEVPSATEQRKKRRRRILKNNSTISLDNASAESIAKLKKRRRKPEASTTTSATPLASIDFSSRKSAFIPVRRRYPKKDEKTNRSNFSDKTAANKTITTPATTKTDNFQVETSTPKTRTIEHRSTVSKEKIVTKTTYPDEAKNFDSMKTNPTSAQRRPVKSRMKSRRRKNNNTRDGNNEDSDNRKELIKQEDKNGNYEVKIANEDEIKKSVISDKPQDGSKGNAVGRFGMKREEVKKINDFGSNEGIVNNENDNGNDGFGVSSEIYAVRNLMQNIPPNQKRNRANERTESHTITENWKDQNYDKANEEEKEGDVRQKQKPLLQAKFIKDPERRLYYYVERK